MSNKKTKECMALQEGSKIWLITRTVSNLTDTPPPPPPPPPQLAIL